MIDVQADLDSRNVFISKVGVRDISHPLIFTEEDVLEKYPTLGHFDLYVSLARDKKGTHMSRFLQVLYEQGTEINFQALRRMAQRLKDTLDSENAFINLSFSYFYPKKAPVSQAEGLSYVQTCVETIVQRNEWTQNLTIKVPVASLCPCSKAISDFGAHSQRSHITLALRNKILPVRTCIQIAEAASSCALYPILKRADEKFVTEKAYSTPRFVEDLVRETALGLRHYDPSLCFEVSAENFESIHNHNVWALVNSQEI